MYAPTILKRGSWIGCSNSFAASRPPRPHDADPGDTATAMAELCRDYYLDRIVSRAEFLSSERSWYAAPTNSRDAMAGDRRLPGVLAAANPRRQLAALELGQLRDLLADRLNRLIVRPVITPGLRVFDARRLQCDWRTPP